MTVLSLLIALLMFTSFLAPVSADDDEDDPKDPPVKFAEKEDVEVKVDKARDRVHVSDKYKNDDFSFKLKLEDGFEARLELEHEDDHVRTQVEVKYTFRCVIGIGDKTPDHFNCNDEDKAVMRFSEMKFEEPEYKEYEKDDLITHKLNVVSEDERFYAMIEFPASFEEAEDGALVPAPISLKVKLKKFELKENDTRMAMVMKIQSNVAVQLVKGMEDGPDQVEPRGQKNEELGSAYLSYSPRANIDASHDDDIEVVKNTIDEETTEVAFIYPECWKVYHDVEMGLLPKAVVLKGDVPLYGATIGAMAALFVLTDPRIYKKLMKK